MAKVRKVVISSTALDLPEHREEVMDACLRMDMFPKMMAHMPASGSAAILASLELVDEADIYVGVFAHRYGYVPKTKTKNPKQISITEMEYNRAVKRRISRLIFVMDKDHLIKAEDVEIENAKKLKAFKDRVGNENIVKFFISPPDLRAEVIHSLGALKERETASQERSPEQQYRELTLEWCNVIVLVNLPENDIPITTKHHDLRWLYVPQRVRVEPTSSAEAGQAIVDTVRNIMQREEEPNSVSIGTCLAESQRLMILGEPGAGKTTLLRWIATSYLLGLKRSPDGQPIPNVETLDWLPILVRCRDLDKSSLSGQLEDILYQVLYRSEIARSRADVIPFLNKLKEGKGLLLIDGLDEIADLNARIRFCQRLETISNVYKKTPIVVTSRIVGYREMKYRLKKFEHVTLADFSKEDKDEFARRWCDLFPSPIGREAATAELIRDIHSTDRIERLTGNPMLLTAMALVKRRFDRLRIRKVELYADLLEVLLYWRHEVEEPLDKDEAIPQLEYLAYEMCERGVQRLLRNEIIELLGRMREEYPQIHAVKKHNPEDFLRLLERRTGILTVTGQTRSGGMSIPVYEFRHPIFREYLAALALVDGRFPGRNPNLSLARNVARLAGRKRDK